MAKCFNCSARKRLHSIPRTPEILKKWKKIIPNAKNADFNKLFKLCSLHFRENLFTNTGKLFWNAIPTLFLNKSGKMWYSVDVNNVEMKEDSDSGEDNGNKEINLPECSGLQSIIAKEEKEHEEEVEGEEEEEDQEEEEKQNEVDHKEENDEKETTEHPISLKCINCSSIGPLHSLPKNRKVMQMWMKVIPIPPVMNQPLRLCKEHFSNDAFDNISGKLYWNAIPNRFINTESGRWYSISENTMEKKYYNFGKDQDLPQINRPLTMYKKKNEQLPVPNIQNETNLSEMSSASENTTYITYKISLDVGKLHEEVVLINEDARTEQCFYNENFDIKCFKCASEIDINVKYLYWQAQTYCNELCLEQYQKSIGFMCATCKKSVLANNLGKFTTRFDNDIKQFCSGLCLILYKKEWKKVCTYCQCKLSEIINFNNNEDNFCSKKCFEKLIVPVNLQKCTICNKTKMLSLKLVLKEESFYFCSEHCFTAFKFANNVTTKKCTTCTKHFDQQLQTFSINVESGTPIIFCSKVCKDVYVMKNRFNMHCSICNMEKYNYDMIQKKTVNGMVLLCSLNCKNVTSTTGMNNILIVRNPCHKCKKLTKTQYNLKSINGAVIKFCSYPCVLDFQSAVSKNVTIKYKAAQSSSCSSSNTNEESELENSVKSTLETMCVDELQETSSISLESSEELIDIGLLSPKEILPMLTYKSSKVCENTTSQKSEQNLNDNNLSQLESDKLENPIDHQNSSSRSILESVLRSAKVKSKTHLIIRKRKLPSIANVATRCQPNVHSTGVSCCPEMSTVECQTDNYTKEKIFIPIPVPVNVFLPMQMYAMPVPVPVPIPLPIPVPVFLPLNCNSIHEMVTQIQEKIPKDLSEKEIINKCNSLDFDFNKIFENFIMKQYDAMDN